MPSKPLHSTFYILHSARASRGGFTLIETLIVIAITAMLSAIAIGYSSTERNIVALSVESSKVSQIILQAESLSIATYGETTNTCGYGVSFNPVAQTYSLFAYEPAGVPPCPPGSSITSIAPSDMKEYTYETWNIRVANGVTLDPGNGVNSIAEVLFYPPEPKTLITRVGDNGNFTNEASHVYLGTIDNAASTTISVSPAGQVSF